MRFLNPFRSGNTAASLKPRAVSLEFVLIVNFPQWKHCGLIEAVDVSDARNTLKIFPQWKHCGLIEAYRADPQASVPFYLSAVETLRPH